MNNNYMKTPLYIFSICIVLSISFVSMAQDVKEDLRADPVDNDSKESSGQSKVEGEQESSPSVDIGKANESSPNIEDDELENVSETNEDSEAEKTAPESGEEELDKEQGVEESDDKIEKESQQPTLEKLRKEIELKRAKRKKETPQEIKKRKSFPENKDGIFLISIPLTGFWRTDKGYDFVSSEPVFWNTGANLEVDVFTFKKRFVFSAGATWQREKEATINTLGGDFDAWWTVDTITLSANARYRLFPWMSPHARLYSGAGITKLIVKDKPGRKKYFKPREAQYIGGIGIGTSFHTPSFKLTKYRIPTLMAGIRIEGGIEFGSSTKVELDLEEDGEHAIDMETYSLGELSRVAPYVRLDGFIRF